MELKDYISRGEEVSGGRKELALKIGLNHPNNLTDAKRGTRGLPLPACWKLADLIGATHDEVSAASELVTEKDESIKAYLRPFVEHARAASIALVAIFLSVTFIVTSDSVKAAPLMDTSTETLCIMLSLYAISIIRKAALIASNRHRTYAPRCCFSG